MDTFGLFVHRNEQALKRIARATRGEHDFGDVANEAWLMAEAIASRTGRPADFADPEFQDLLIRHLYQALVRYTELNVRHAVRLDHAAAGDDESDTHWLANRLASDGGRDPLSHLLAGEEPVAGDGEHHPSLAGAWVKLLWMSGGRMRTVARKLLISVSHTYRCHAKAVHLAQTQNSIPFDLEGLEAHLGPWRRSRVVRIPRQLEFDFEDELPIRDN